MTEHNVTKTFDVLYAHPDGGFRFIATVPLTANGEMHMSHWLEELFWRMQGENWSPNGEARELIKAKGVQHTSMSVGDIAWDIETGEVWKVADMGWVHVNGAPCWSGPTLSVEKHD
jgi:hypothetical protein